MIFRLVCVAFACVAGYSHENLNSQIYDLGRIEILSDKIDKNSALQTISQDQIHNLNANDVGSALRTTPGIFYNATSISGSAEKGQPTIKMRGFEHTQIGVFIDGIPIHSIYDRESDFAQISSFGISEINISKGYTSPVYGSNTLGGAINIVTTKPQDELEINAKYAFVSNNENRVALQIGSNQEKYYTLFSYSFSQRDSVNLSQNFKTTPMQPNKDKKFGSNYKNHTLRAKIGFTPNEDEYSLNVIYQKGEKGGAISANAESPFWYWPYYDKLTIYALGNSTLSQKLALNSRIYYDTFKNKLNAYGRIDTNGEFQKRGYQGVSIYDDYAIGIIETLNIDITEFQNLKLGVNARNDVHRERDGDGKPYNAKFDEIVSSSFAEYAIQINDIFRFVGSASFDKTQVQDAWKGTREYNKNHLQGWNLQGILYAYLNENWMLHANIGKKSILPTLKARYTTGRDTTTPNPNLQTESAINYELGAKFENQNLSVGANVFFNDINNLLISLPDTTNSCLAGANCVYSTNARVGYSWGVETFLKYEFDEFFSVYANYSYVQKKDTSSSKVYDGARILNYPNHIANAGLSFRPFRMLEFVSNASYQSKSWHYAAPNFMQNNDVFLMDLFTKIFAFENLEFQIGAYNLLDRNYYYGAGYYQAGRRFLASVEFRF